jgi:hypothetical protein
MFANCLNLSANELLSAIISFLGAVEATDLDANDSVNLACDFTFLDVPPIF